MSTKAEATIEDLYSIEGKAESLTERLSTCHQPGKHWATRATRSLCLYVNTVKRTGEGRAVGDNKGFSVNLPHRKFFSPDTAYHVGRLAGAKFLRVHPLSLSR
ncbi:MAG TPA: hypothetical protein VM866_06280 [Pyrinomonadaceae bacterium]|nr:hypothetical protein [Pyrinomonadaceae bacterium]